ncbi:MAG: VWA domain-containing protein [Spirochaetales bacterium]|nr:VWA domain-containing protein [Spirochaetales bacterium]
MVSSTLWAQTDLKLSSPDLMIEEGREGGYHIYVKKKPGLGSVLLTESSADPEKRLHSYALRAGNFNSINGNEKRMLDGDFIDPDEKIYSIIDSTPENVADFGLAFHLFIPYVVQFGYDWTRQGEIQVTDGTYLNFRAFEKPFGDYTGAYYDNPFVMRIIQKPIKKSEKPEENYLESAEKSFKEIAEKGKGELKYALGPDNLIDKIEEILMKQSGDSLDFVLVLDTTKSMEDEMPIIKRDLIPTVRKITAGFSKVRLGLVIYRDYLDEYLNKSFPFTNNLQELDMKIRMLSVHGGRDNPEAVYEALHEAETAFDWQAQARLIILIGDAPPHPKARGKITSEMVYDEAEKRGIEIHSILLPQS